METSGLFVSTVLESRTIFILRTSTAEHLEGLVHTLWDAGARCIEITRNSPGVLDVLGILSRKVPSGCFLGMGTVLTADQVNEAARVGVAFIVSPVCSKSVQAAAAANGLRCIPGALTPTEIDRAWSWGADFVKIFPATSPHYIKEIRAPLHHVPLLAVGGVTFENAADYLMTGCVGVGVGNSLLGVEPSGKFDPVLVRARAQRLSDLIADLCFQSGTDRERAAHPPPSPAAG